MAGTRPQESTDPLVLLGKQLLGRYTIQSRLAQGGMSVVYQGRDERLQRPVCLKVFFGYFALIDNVVPFDTLIYQLYPILVAANQSYFIAFPSAAVNLGQVVGFHVLRVTLWNAQGS